MIANQRGDPQWNGRFCAKFGLSLPTEALSLTQPQTAVATGAAARMATGLCGWFKSKASLGAPRLAATASTAHGKKTIRSGSN
jgi:hypothetical protein